MIYSSELIDQIKDRIDVVDLVSEYVKLKKSGSGYMGLCPFHSEKSPSFSVSPIRQSYHCFGCGKGGDIFSFLMEYDNLTFPEAVRQLGERAGVTIPEDRLSQGAAKQEKQRARFFRLNKEAATYYYCLLRSPAGKEGMEYLRGRGLSEETINGFGLGFAGSGKNRLSDYLRSRGFSEQEIREAALAGFDEKRGLYDFFWNRVIFPIMDTQNRVIGFGGRVMGDGKPKYLNSRETMIFDKGKNLFGLNRAKSSRKKRFILCEGYMDVISQHQAGFTEAVASLGTAFTPAQARILKKYSDRIYLAYDSDNAGVNAAIRNGDILRQAGINCKVISLAPYKDPDEFVKALGAEEYEKRIEGAENVFLYELRMLNAAVDRSDPAARTRFARECAEKLTRFEDPLERESYLTAVSESFGISPKDLRAAVMDAAGRTELIARRSPVITREEREARKKDREARPEKYLLRLMFEEPSILPRVKEFLGPEDFIPPYTGQLARVLFSPEFAAHPVLEEVLLHLEGEEREFAGNILTLPPEEWEREEDKEKALKEVIRSVKENSINSRSEEISVVELIRLKKRLEDL